MASNPPGACCASGFKHEGTPIGEVKDFNGGKYGYGDDGALHAIKRRCSSKFWPWIMDSQANLLPESSQHLYHLPQGQQ